MVSQVHPTPKTIGNAFVALELAAGEAEQKRGKQQQGVNEAEKITGLATNPATLRPAARGVIQ